MASVGAIGTMLIVFFLSIYMVIDRDAILAFLFRLVPPSYAEEARLLQTSVARSFGGFLRGQALMGIVYFLIALADEPAARPAARGADLDRVRACSWPSRSSARSCPGRRRSSSRCVFKPEALLPAIVIMAIGWFIVMNVLQPRIMQGAVGIHPIVVLGSVLIGSRIAGHPRRDLRDPGRGRRVRVLLPLPPPHVGRPDGRGPRGQAPQRARGPAGARAARADARAGRPTSSNRERRARRDRDGDRRTAAERPSTRRSRT